MNFAEYEARGKDLYRDFALTIRKIIEEALAAKQIRAQQIQHRAKDPASLRRKLEKEGILVEIAIEEQIKDLAGCRIIVYSNLDLNRLNDARILSENFDIIFDRTKFHFPRSDLGNAVSQFIGYNYVVTLKEDRRNLDEYRKFKDLLCEVQVQTILDHAWSEAAHDTIYKMPTLNQIGEGHFAQLEARMNDIQRKYLLPAGYEFQKVLVDFERLVTGQRLLEADILAEIRSAQNNNECVELLETFKDQVLGQMDEPATRAFAPDIRSMLIEVVERAFKAAVEPIEMPFGSLPGKSASDVLEIVLKMLGRIQYIDPDETFDVLVQIHGKSHCKADRALIKKSVGELAQNELAIWRARLRTH